MELREEHATSVALPESCELSSPQSVSAVAVGEDRFRRPTAEQLMLLAVIGLASAVHFFRLGNQSFSLDEALTVGIVKGGFVQMFQTISHSETTPPVYYLSAWLWARLFGFGEVGLRSMSALAGTLTVPVAYVAVRRLLGQRVALFAAVLIAVNPFLLYYSQEARSYSLMVFLSTCTLWAFAEAWTSGSRRALTAWSLLGALSLSTHYFAGFPLVGEAGLLLWRWRSQWRIVLFACGGWVVTGLALLPLLRSQQAEGGFGFITQVPLQTRVTGILHDFVVGSRPFPVIHLPIAAATVAVLGVALAVALGNDVSRRAVGALLVIAVAAVAIPLAVAAGGLDYLLSRNEMPLLVPFLAISAAGFALIPRRVAGIALLVISVGLAVVADGYYDFDPSLQRDDWRSVAAQIGPRGTPIVVSPGDDTVALSVYAPDLVVDRSRRDVDEVDVVGQARPPRFTRPPTPHRFTLVQDITTPTYELLRYKSATALPVSSTQLQRIRLGSTNAAIVVQQDLPPTRADRNVPR